MINRFKLWLIKILNTLADTIYMGPTEDELIKQLNNKK